MYMCNKYHITPCFFSTSFPSTHLNSHTPRDFLTYKSFGEIDSQGVRPSPSPLSPRVGVGVWVGLVLVYLVLEHEVFREAGLRSRDKILCSDWSPTILDEELACRHVGQDRLFFKNAVLYVKSCVETFFSVKVMGKYVIQA